MTQLRTISNNHMSLQCRCGHSKLLSVKELIGKLSPTTTIYEVARKAKCSHCGTKGAVISGCIIAYDTRSETVLEPLVAH